MRFDLKDRTFNMIRRVFQIRGPAERKARDPKAGLKWGWIARFCEDDLEFVELEVDCRVR